MSETPADPNAQDGVTPPTPLLEPQPAPVSAQGPDDEAQTVTPSDAPGPAPPPPPGPARGWADDTWSGPDGERRRALASLMAGFANGSELDTNADALASGLGWPLAAVRADPEGAAINLAMHRAGAALRGAPQTARWLGRDMENANAAKHDVEPLTRIEAHVGEAFPHPDQVLLSRIGALDAAARAARATRLAGKSPARLGALADALAPDAVVYAPADLLRQAADALPDNQARAVAALLGPDSDQEPDQPVAIPLSRYLSSIAPTDAHKMLIGSLSLTPYGPCAKDVAAKVGAKRPPAPPERPLRPAAPPSADWRPWHDLMAKSDELETQYGKYPRERVVERSLYDHDWPPSKRKAAEAAPPPLPPMAANRIDWGFIGQREGAAEVVAYVPKEKKGKTLVPSGHSGVTVATGVDLGQRNEHDLRVLKLSENVIATLKPYLGLRGKAADDYLTAHPLTLDAGAVADIDAKVQRRTLNSAVETFDRDSRVGHFSDLPPGAQTAIMDVIFQYGSPGAVPDFWRQVTQGDWPGALTNLEAFRDEHRTRRQEDADRLRADIVAGRLPKPPPRLPVRPTR